MAHASQRKKNLSHEEGSYPFEGGAYPIDGGPANFLQSTINKGIGPEAKEVESWTFLRVDAAEIRTPLLSLRGEITYLS